MVQVLRRFFVLVIASIAVLLATGVPLLMQVPGAQAPRGWHAMAGLGVLMVLVFGHIFFAPWRRMQRAVAAQEWPEGGKARQPDRAAGEGELRARLDRDRRGDAVAMSSGLHRRAGEAVTMQA